MILKYKNTILNTDHVTTILGAGLEDVKARIFLTSGPNLDLVESTDYFFYLMGMAAAYSEDGLFADADEYIRRDYIVSWDAWQKSARGVSDATE